MGRVLTGRKKIYTPTKIITKNNVVDVLNASLSTFQRNKSDINYLYEYWKGNQLILSREKIVRPEINNKVVVNMAYEIVSFKTGYLLGDPVQYVNRNTDEASINNLNTLNDYMVEESKDAADRELAEWFSICGVGYRLIVPNNDDTIESPVRVYTLDPRETAVVRYSGFSKEPVMAFVEIFYEDTDDRGDTVLKPMYSVYTKDNYFEIKDDKVVYEEANLIGMIPIVEYQSNSAMLGEFEIVLPLLDALNLIKSNRVDGVEQFIQSLIKFINVDIDSESYRALMELGAIKLMGSDGNIKQDVEFMSQELNQAQVQTLEDSIKQDILVICGMPNRNGGSSTSDTGAAVIMRDGWSDAESRAKSTELMFKRSERQLLKLMLEITKTLTLKKIDLKVSDIEIRFTRRNYENILEKSQVLTTMLGNEKIDPKLAFIHSGMFIDPDLAYAQSKAYYEEWQGKLEKLKEGDDNDKRVDNEDN